MKKESIIKWVIPFPVGILAVYLLLLLNFKTDIGKTGTFIVFMIFFPIFCVWYAVYFLKTTERVILFSLYNAAVLTFGYILFDILYNIASVTMEISFFIWMFVPTFLCGLILKGYRKRREKYTEWIFMKKTVGVIILATALPIVLPLSLICGTFLCRSFPHRYEFMHKIRDLEDIRIEIVHIEYQYSILPFSPENPPRDLTFEDCYDVSKIKVVSVIEDTDDFIDKLLRIRCRKQYSGEKRYVSGNEVIWRTAVVRFWRCTMDYFPWGSASPGKTY